MMKTRSPLAGSLIATLLITGAAGFAMAEDISATTKTAPQVQPMPPAVTIPDAAKTAPISTTAPKAKEKPKNPDVETGGSLTETRRKEQDQLFTDLRKASTPEKSHAIASRLRQNFVRTGSDSLDLMLRWAETALNQSREAEAQDYIAEVMAQRPDNATVWQLRARLHLRRNELAPALRDIRQAMILEPRNFDVLINYATLLRETGNRKGALRLYHQALSVYPMMKEAQDEMLKLTEADSDTAL
ncbi:hypothetical protein KQ944_14995 [Bacillus subtilis]|uniref:tetratricopeptide repeat protein n=1 Tax=Pseudochrobactrum asaccharolyticum TaxID=354351 RepID=UPI001F3599F7|nr:hypothetical protein [Pseudochrobactrum asaccharolyticum]MCF7646195.1 hypothetical protein [Pseudochrobactrum asaccharolyticum]MCF7672942.1 hypothetical protein [Bacillus subtilis]